MERVTPARRAFVSGHDFSVVPEKAPKKGRAFQPLSTTKVILSEAPPRRFESEIAYPGAQRRTPQSPSAVRPQMQSGARGFGREAADKS
jgi:hypothetical protein